MSEVSTNFHDDKHAGYRTFGIFGSRENDTA